MARRPLVLTLLLLCMSMLALLAASAGAAEARTLSVKQAKVATKGGAKKIMKKMTRRSASRGGRAKVGRCSRKTKRTVRCRFRMNLADGRVCRNAKMTVRLRKRTKRLSRRFHRRAMRCATPLATSRKRKPAGPAPAPAPSTSYKRLYNDASPWNNRIGTGAPAHSNSAAMIGMLNQEIATNGWPIASGAWTNTIYYADSTTPRQDVPLTGGYAGRSLMGVPIPEHARVPADSDGGMVVIDRSNGCEYDLARASRDGNGRWSAWFANALPSGGDGVYPFAEAPSASGFASAGGTIMPEEMAAGRIDHALAFTMKNAKLGGPVSPATASDGRSAAPGAIPEGARLQLDPNLNLDSLGLRPWEKTIARALQEYGMYLVDTGGAVALRAQHTASTSYTYPWGTGDYGQVPPALARYMKVLDHGPQFATQYRFVFNGCNRLG